MNKKYLMLKDSPNQPIVGNQYIFADTLSKLKEKLANKESDVCIRIALNNTMFPFSTKNINWAMCYDYLAEEKDVFNSKKPKVNEFNPEFLYDNSDTSKPIIGNSYLFADSKEVIIETLKHNVKICSRLTDVSSNTDTYCCFPYRAENAIQYAFCYDYEGAEKEQKVKDNTVPFDEKNVFTALNAQGLPPESYVLVANTITGLKMQYNVKSILPIKIKSILPEDYDKRFHTQAGDSSLAYLISKAEPKPKEIVYLYKVDVSWMHGKLKDVVMNLIIEKAMDKGYSKFFSNGSYKLRTYIVLDGASKRIIMERGTNVFGYELTCNKALKGEY